jgi:uncharacterized phiE125 gp8 family phage protein
MSIEITVLPTEEPVTLTEAKAHLRVTGTDDDTYITSLISAARQRAETYISRAICEQTLAYSLDAFPTEFALPRAPVSSITSITYTDEDGNTGQVLSDSLYQSNIVGSADNKISPAVNQSWPSTQSSTYNAVTVTYVAGWDNPTASPIVRPLPTPIKQGILLMIGEMYENREESVVGLPVFKMPTTSAALLAPFRLSMI